MTDLDRIARILCEADGCDPDALVYTLPMAVDRHGRVFAPAEPPVPTWQLYIFMVRTVIEAVMTDADGTDMHTMLQDILDQNEEAPPVDEAVEEDVSAPARKPGWRAKYGLVHNS